METFSDVFRGYRKGTLTWSGLKLIVEENKATKYAVYEMLDKPMNVEVFSVVIRNILMKRWFQILEKILISLNIFKRYGFSFSATL